MSANQGGIYSVLDNEDINGREAFFEGVSQGIDSSWATGVGTVVPSDSEIETYADLGNVPQLSVWEGEALFQELPNYVAKLRNVEYAAGLTVQKADFRRDKVGRIAPRLRDLGRRGFTHWETLVSTLISNAETDGSATIGGEVDLTSQAYDGQAFFDTDHSYTGSNYTTSQSNDLAAGTYSNLNVTTATAPTPDEAANIITDLLGHFWTLKDDQGEPANGDARAFTIMVGTNQLFAPIVSALGLSNLSSGASNRASGFIQTQGLAVNAVLNPRLSAKTTKVYIFRTDGDLKPFILQDEVGLNVQEEDPGMKVKHFEVMSSATRAAGYGKWDSALVGTLS